MGVPKNLPPQKVPITVNLGGSIVVNPAVCSVPAFASPDQDFLDLRHEIRASYAVQTTSTQELAAGGLTPEQQRQQEVLKLAIEMDDTQQRIQRSLDVAPVTDVVQTLETEAWSLPDQLRAQVFQNAQSLGIPTNNSTFATELENQTHNATARVLGRLSFLMDQFRIAHEKKVEDYAKIAGSVHKQGQIFQEFFDNLGLDLNESLRNETLQKIATEGYSDEMRDYLTTQGFNDTEIAQMRTFVSQHAAELAKVNFTQAHDQLRDAYVQAIEDSANLSTQVLLNSMSFNREANLTVPLSQAGLEVLGTVQSRAESDLELRNWTGLRTSAHDLAVVTFYHALQTGGPIFVGRYVNSTLAWAAAEIALSGDNESAARMVEGLLLESHIYVTRTSPLFTSVNTNGGTVTVSYTVTRVVPEAVDFAYMGTVNPSGPPISCSGETSIPLDRVSASFSCTAGAFATAGEFNVAATVLSRGETFSGPSMSVSATQPGGGGGTPGSTPPPSTPPPGFSAFFLTVSVVGPSGNPVPYASIVLSATSTTGTSLLSTSTQVGGDGTLRLSVPYQSPSVNVLLTCQQSGFFPGITQRTYFTPTDTSTTCRLTSFGQAVQMGTVTGAVVEDLEEGGERPLDGVLVRVDGYPTQTDSNGRYSLQAPVGTHTVRFEKEGYAAGVSNPFKMPPDAVVGAELRRDGGSLVTVIQTTGTKSQEFRQSAMTYQTFGLAYAEGEIAKRIGQGFGSEAAEVFGSFARFLSGLVAGVLMTAEPAGGGVPFTVRDRNNDIIHLDAEDPLYGRTWGDFSSKKAEFSEVLAVINGNLATSVFPVEEETTRVYVGGNTVVLVEPTFGDGYIVDAFTFNPTPVRIYDSQRFGRLEVAEDYFQTHIASDKGGKRTPCKDPDKAIKQTVSDPEEVWTGIGALSSRKLLWSIVDGEIALVIIDAVSKIIITNFCPPDGLNYVRNEKGGAGEGHRFPINEFIKIPK